jgi:hypothetical protein
MSTIDPVRGIVQDGKVVFQSGGLPEGTAVTVIPVAMPRGDGSEAADAPEVIAAWLSWYDALEPLEWTDAERAAWDADRLA